MEHDEELDEDNCPSAPFYNCQKCFRRYYSWKNFHRHSQSHAENDALNRKFKLQNFPVMKPLLQGLVPNQAIQIVNSKASGAIKIMRLNQPIGQNISSIHKLPSKVSVVKKESQLHQQALDVTPGLGFIKVIYPFRISLSNGYELVQRLKCNSCASAGINFSTFFPNILQNHEVSVHGKAGPHGQISLCQVCNRFKNPAKACKEQCASKPRIKACMFCDEVFNHQLRLDPPSRLLKQHIETVHGINSMLYQCADCPFESTNEIEFNCHLHSHQLSVQKNVTKFACTLCPVACISLEKLKAHSKVHFTTRRHVVVDCTHFERKRRLSKKIRQSKCRYCSKHFNLHSNRLQHEAMAHKRKQARAKFYRKPVGICSQQCSVCSKTFSTKVDKWNHELGVHCLKNIMWQNQTQSVREYSWTLNTGSGLNEQGKNEFRVYQSRKAALRNTVKNEDTKREEIVHQKSQKHLENLIRCSESGRPFSKNLSLMTDCEFCPMKYLSRQALRAHEKAEHMDKNELWLCMFCTKTYISRHELRSHIVSKHPADFHQKLREFHNERLKTEDLQKSTLPPVAPKVDQKDGQLLCELCNTVCKTFGLFSLARITEAQKTCILNHTSTSTQKTIRWFMKSHFPYFYDKYLCEKSVSTKLSKFQNFHMNCPLKVTHVNRWKRQQTSTKRKNVEVPIIKSEYKALPTSGPLPKLLRLAPKGLMSGQSVVLAAPETK